LALTDGHVVARGNARAYPAAARVRERERELSPPSAALVAPR